VFVGRLDHQKRIIELIKALDFAENPYRQFLIIGDGPLREQVESLASNTVYVHVKCMGWVDTQAQTEILRPTDILVLNSAIEGEPTVLREAAVRGMRAIAADIPGVRGVSNRVFRFRGARGLQALLMSPVLIEGGSLRCRKQFRAHVDRSKQVAKIFG
jgi:glycosyltransferase involved in cell wall biosynthesis